MIYPYRCEDYVNQKMLIKDENEELLMEKNKKLQVLELQKMNLHSKLRKAEDEEERWKGKVHRAQKHLRRQMKQWKKVRGENEPVFSKKTFPNLSSYLEIKADYKENFESKTENLQVQRAPAIRKAERQMELIREEQINRTLKSILW